jgi:hypothetical protein
MTFAPLTSQVGIVVVCNLRHPLIAPVSKARTKYDKPDEVPMKRRSVSATEYPRFEVMFGYYPFDATIDFLKHRHLSRRRPSLMHGGKGHRGDRRGEHGTRCV